MKRRFDVYSLIFIKSSQVNLKVACNVIKMENTQPQMMKPAKILIAEDDAKTSSTIELYLKHEGFIIQQAKDGAQALEIVKTKSPDLMILDLMLPVLDGLSVCREVRKFSEIPIILLTARTEEEDKLKGLHLGADDYITKPFSPRELVARVQTVLRRSRRVEGKRMFQTGDLVIDFIKHEVRIRQALVTLTPTEFKLLQALARSPGRVFTRTELVERAFGSEFEGFDRTVDAHIMNLRKKIESNRNQPSFIVTVFGIGYKFQTNQDVS